MALGRARGVVPRRRGAPAAARQLAFRVSPRSTDGAHRLREQQRAPARTSPGLNSAHSLARTRSQMRLPCARHISSSDSRRRVRCTARAAPRAPVASPSADDVAAADREVDARGEHVAARLRARKRTALPSYASECLMTCRRSRAGSKRTRCLPPSSTVRSASARAWHWRSAAPSQRSGSCPARPGDDRLRRRVLAAVEREAAVELGLDAVNHGKEAVGREVVHEAQRGALRADRIRGRRPGPDAIQLERADVQPDSRLRKTRAYVRKSVVVNGVCELRGRRAR